MTEQADAITHTLTYGEPTPEEDKRTITLVLSAVELDLIEAALDHYQDTELLRGTEIDNDEPCDVASLHRSFDLQTLLKSVR